MAITVKIPQLKEKYVEDAKVKLIKDELDRIKSNYGSMIANISTITEVPQELLISFIFIESMGNPTAISSANAIGLMQLIPAAASDVLVMSNNKKKLNESEKQLLTKYMGIRFTEGIEKMKYLGDKVTVNGVKSAVWVTKADLLKPEFNILCGAIYLGMLLDEEQEGGKPRLDRVVVRYNRGYFAKKKGLEGSTADIIKNSPKETQGYIKKLLATNGILDILV